MGRSKAAKAAPSTWDPDTVPLEFHGHRKKLNFIWSSVERYRLGRGLAPAQVRVLEVGCSNGRNVTTPLARYGYEITGLDIHRESIEYARSQTPLPNARFLCEDLAQLPDTERFEVVILADVLEHVNDPEWLCRESMRHLTPDGLVLISIPNGFGPYEIEQRLLKRTRLDRFIEVSKRKIGRLLRRPAYVGRPSSDPAYNYDSGHVQFFHLEDFERLLDRVGLEVIQRANGALFGGTLSLLLVGRFPSVAAASLRLADLLPMRWVTTWYFCCTARNSASIFDLAKIQ
jgi:2-polyprenyl-3-methyl-5-hydroxy-6-metoxy-1,4-benzoquinol methylase